LEEEKRGEVAFGGEKKLLHFQLKKQNNVSKKVEVDLISSLFSPLFSMESKGIHLSDACPLHASVCYKSSSLIVEEIHI